MASNRHAPEGTYDPYRGDDAPGGYGAYGSYSSYHQDHNGYDTLEDFDSFGHASFGTYGGGFDGRGGFQQQYGAPQQYGDSGQYGGATGQFDTGQFHTGQFDTGQFQTGAYGHYDTHAALWTETNEIPAVPFADDKGHVAGPPPADPADEWNPTEESVRPVRGRHKVVKQRGGSMARSSAVLGVGMIAAVGAGGMATAQEKQPTSISIPDVSVATEKAKELPGVGTLLSGGESDDVVAGEPLTQAALTADDAEAGHSDAGDALRSRILQQAEEAQSKADASAREAAAKKATDDAEAKVKKQLADKRKAEAEKRRKAEEARLAKLAKSYTLPVAGAQLTSHFGESGSLWSNDHTGQDFAASTGTPIKAIGSGTVKEAGWSGSYGYRTVLELKDGTELWYAHQSSMNVSVGEKVTTGDVIGRVGATGNVTGAHLHLEIRPGGGDPIDPMAWLRGKGLSI